MSTDPPAPVRRILLALDSARDLAALEAATRLAEVLQASVEALFVEDDALLRMAGLPFAKEIGSGSAAVRPMERGRLERELRHRAAELQAVLARRAQSARLQWSFSTVRGVLPAVALEFIADLYVLPRRGRSYPAPQRRVPGPVVVLYDGSPPASRALEAVSGLVDGSPLLLLVTRTVTPDLLRQALAPLEAHGRTVTCLPITGIDTTAVAAAVQHHRASLLVFGAGSIPPTDLDRLLDTIDTPILIAR